jgi:hypothetical protein
MFKAHFELTCFEFTFINYHGPLELFHDKTNTNPLTFIFYFSQQGSFATFHQKQNIIPFPLISPMNFTKFYLFPSIKQNLKTPVSTFP